jgi:hypothetical protein
VTLLHQAVELVDDSEGNFRNLMDEVLDRHHRAYTCLLEGPVLPKLSQDAG